MRHIYTKIFRSEFACLHGEAVGGFWDFSGFQIRKNPLFPPCSNLNLYVPDCWNNRIQLFPSGQPNGTTVPINGSSGVFLLNTPTDVTLDMNGYLFIVDYLTHRILGSGSAGFRCVAGCTDTGGSAANQLSSPHSLSFDSFGNLFVIDVENVRLQKFLLAANACGEFSIGKYFYRRFSMDENSIIRLLSV